MFACGVPSTTGATGIGLRVGFLVPHTDAHRFRAAWDDERHLVLEAWLLVQQGHDVVLKRPGTLRHALGLELHTHRTRNHVSLLGREDSVRADNLSSRR